MDTSMIVKTGQALSQMAPVLGRELERIGGEMRSGRMERNEASKQLYKAIDKEVKRVRAYDVTGHSAAQVQQLVHLRTKIATGVLKENWRESFPLFKKMWQSAQTETALPRWLMRIGGWFSESSKLKWVCRIGATSIGAVAFAGKLLTNADARRQAGQVLQQTSEVAKGYAIQFCETAKTVAKKAVAKVKTTVAAVAHKVATGIRSATARIGSAVTSAWRKIAAWF